MRPQGVKPTVKEANKGERNSGEAQVEALLGAVCIAEKAAEAQGQAVEDHHILCTGVM